MSEMTGTYLANKNGPGRIEFLGAPLDLLTMDETIEIALTAMKKKQRVQHVVVNVAKLVSMGKNPVLKRDVQESDLINIDGTGVLWGCRLMGYFAPERVAGIDLMMSLLAVCEREGFRPYFLGAREEVLAKAIEEARKKHPKLDVAGWRNGYFNRDEETEIVEAINGSKADCLFVAISSPMKENFLHRWREDLKTPFLMGVGGSVDVLAGRVKRAPLWMQKLGLEWLYRLLQEPRRMWRRYLFTNLEYSVILSKALLGKYLFRQAEYTSK